MRSGGCSTVKPAQWSHGTGRGSMLIVTKPWKDLKRVLLHQLLEIGNRFYERLAYQISCWFSLAPVPPLYAVSSLKLPETSNTRTRIFSRQQLAAATTSSS